MSGLSCRSARVKDAKASILLIAAHRVGGYLFITLFCVMGYFMVARLGETSAAASHGTMIHLTLAMVLSLRGSPYRFFSAFSRISANWLRAMSCARAPRQ